MRYFDSMNRSRVYRHAFVAIMTFVCMIAVRSQDATISLPYTRYTVADGLAQMQVRHLFVDQEGLVWIGTQGGLSVFDGSEIRTFNDPGPLSEEYIMTLARGSDRLYISTIQKSYSFDGLNIKPLDSNQSTVSANVLFEDSQHAIWLKDNHITTKTYVYKDGAYENPSAVYPALENISIQRAWGHPTWDKCYIIDWQNRFYVFNPACGDLSIDSTTFSPSDNLSLNWNVSADRNSIIFQCRDPFSDDLYSVRDLYRLSGDRMEHVATRTAKDGLLRSLSPNAPMGYVGELGGVSTFFLLQDSIYRPDIMPRFSYIRFMVEANHKMYLGTDNGFIVVHGDGLETLSFPPCDYAWSVVPGQDNDVYLGCYKSGVFQLGASGRLTKHFVLPDLKHGGVLGEQILSNYLIGPDAIYWGSNNGFLALKRNNAALEHVLAPRSIEALALDPVNKSIIAGSDKIIWFPSDLSRRTDSMELKDGMLGGGFINDLAITDDRHLWVAAPGGNERINLEDRTSFAYTFADSTLPCRGGVTLDVDQDGNLWSGGTCGLMVLRVGTDRFEQILPDIIRQRVNQVTILSDKRLVCASNNNLYLLDISHASPTIISIYNRKNGLNLNEPSENGSCLADDRYVWLPSVSGIQRLDLHHVPDSLYPAKLMLLRINSVAVPFLDMSSVALDVVGPAALLDLAMVDHSGREWQYQFQLGNGSFSPWQSAHEILVTGLQHGKNYIRIRASWNVQDPDSYVETLVTVSASLPFLNRSLIQRILIGFSVLMLMLIVASIIRTQRSAQREHKLRSDLYRNRLRTIQAYLNPHFLFNTLTSIQDHILHQDAKAGNDMIVRLSRVFRKVLDIGRYEENKIPMTRLSEEIALIKDIVYLNNKQLTVPVRFDLQIDPALENTDPLIPPMLIQPFVENAFKHAFGENDVDKYVLVHITKTKETLFITIRDNGKGYAPTESTAENSAMGTQLTRERMTILNALNVENNIDVEATDPHGTLVTIKIKLMT
jgi:hypothetical protein